MRIDSHPSLDSLHASPTDSPTRPQDWAHVPCPLCGRQEHVLFLKAASHYFGTSGAVTLMQCPCGMVLTNPQPQGDTLAAFYATPQYYTHKIPTGLKPRLQRTWQRLQMRGPLMHLRLILENSTNLSRFAKRNAPTHFPLRRGMRLLDFGCGDGQLVRLAAALGLDAIGVEPDDAARDAALAAGTRIVKTIEQAELALSGAAYDRIILRHVLEHLPHPCDTLRQLSSRLAPAGRILISVPNVMSKQAQLFGPCWLGYELPRHLWHFSPTTLSRLVEKANLRPLHMTTVELLNYAHISNDRLATQTGHRCAYCPNPVNRLEADGAGTEIVLVAARADSAPRSPDIRPETPEKRLEAPRTPAPRAAAPARRRSPLLSQSLPEASEEPHSTPPHAS